MSVSLIISNPKNKFEATINVPIATELVFQSYWMPVIEQLNLKWAKCFQSGIEIEKDDLEIVLDDLKKIHIWVDNQMEYERGTQIKERIDNLYKKLVDIFREARGDLKVYIG